VQRLRKLGFDESRFRHHERGYREKQQKADDVAEAHFETACGQAKLELAEAQQATAKDLTEKLSANESHLETVIQTRCSGSVVAFFRAFTDAKQREQSAKPAPPIITDSLRFEHTHILGPSGSGKTTLLQEMVLDYFARGADAPALVIIDPKGLMIDRISVRAPSNLRSLSWKKTIARYLSAMSPVHFDL
jgi:ATPase subunit of ABC transporter with duplicated ATPase domains